MRLYKLPRNSLFTLSCPFPLSEQVFLFKHIDGMYSYCLDADKQVVHFSAITEVIMLDEAIQHRGDNGEI